MTDAEHYRKLERLYAAAPVSQWYGATIAIAEGQAEVRIATRAEFYHAAHAVHGSVYFRALDDAAFFAVNSRVREVLVLTVSFTVHFARPGGGRQVTVQGRARHNVRPFPPWEVTWVIDVRGAVASVGLDWGCSSVAGLDGAGRQR